MNKEECCGTCLFHRTDRDGEWYCNNKGSDNYADYTSYEDGEDCEDYEQRN